MIKALRYKGVLFCGLFTAFTADENRDEFEKYKEARGLYVKDPWERVKIIFTKDDHGDSHPEFKQALEMFRIGLVVGASYGGIINAARKVETYMYRNDTKIFGTQREAIAAFVNHNTLSFFNGAIKSAIPFGIFFGGFSLISSCCEAYYNKPRIINSSIAGIVMGGLSRFMFGAKGMISGGVVGGVIGTVYGVALLAVTKLTKTDQVELKYSQFAFRKYRERLSESRLASEEDEAIAKAGVHSKHFHNPLDTLDDIENSPKISDKHMDK